jgi:hypothetical protein
MFISKIEKKLSINTASHSIIILAFKFLRDFSLQFDGDVG